MPVTGDVKLTNRERQVVGLVCRGLSNKGIAKELGLSPATIKYYVHKICRKLGVRNRKELIVAFQLMSRAALAPYRTA